MKKNLFLIVGIVLCLSSCTIHSGLTTNLNNHNTEVVLSRNNYKVVEKVQGESRALYIFGIGGLSKKALIAEARAKMLARSNIIGGSKAVINETVEVSYSFFPFVRFYNVTVSAHIIEFTD